MSTTRRSALLALLALSTGGLAACGGASDGTPAAAVVPSTEVAAVDTPKPVYDERIACANIGGTSTLKVVVGVAGTPTAVSVLQSSGQPALDDAAVKAVETWKFAAATRNGQPIPQTINVPVRFTPPTIRPDSCFSLDAQEPG